ncbi:MAG: hypothetical protein KIPDCIKN_03859 [Haliscomenobacter sp.]|nr:hypothetical protein [Haliscomenobacter sp.]
MANLSGVVPRLPLQRQIRLDPSGLQPLPHQFLPFEPRIHGEPTGFCQVQLINGCAGFRHMCLFTKSDDPAPYFPSTVHRPPSTVHRPPSPRLPVSRFCPQPRGMFFFCSPKKRTKKRALLRPTAPWQTPSLYGLQPLWMATLAFILHSERLTP